MQTIALDTSSHYANIQDLQAKLTQYAPAYFDSYVLEANQETGMADLKFMVGNTAAFIIRTIVSGSANYYPHIVSGEMTWDSGAYYNAVVSKMYITADAVVMSLTGYDFSAMIALCKRTDDKTAVMFFASTGAMSLSSLSTGLTAKCTIISVNGTTGSTDVSYFPTYFESNSDSEIMSNSAYSSSDGVSLKNVYVVFNSDNRSHADPFVFTVGGINYTGFGGIYIAVKGT